MHLHLVQGPAWEPVTVEDLKGQSVIRHDADDAYLAAFVIPAAREQVEADTGRALVEQTWELTGTRFPAEILLPKPPLVDVVHIRYIDADGNQQTLDPALYQVHKAAVNARVRPAPGERWPTVQRDRLGAVTVRFTAGYITGSEAEPQGDIPARARQALLILAADLYENREMQSPVAMHELPAYRSLLAQLETGLI